jgi:hypothetical protein
MPQVARTPTLTLSSPIFAEAGLKLHFSKERPWRIGSGGTLWYFWKRQSKAMGFALSAVARCQCR